MSKFCETTPGVFRRGLDRFTTAVGGASLTLSLSEAIGPTAMRVTYHESALAVDIFRLEHGSSTPARHDVAQPDPPAAPPGEGSAS